MNIIKYFIKRTFVVLYKTFLLFNDFFLFIKIKFIHSIVIKKSKKYDRKIKNIAIIAIYPSLNYLKFLKNLADALSEHNFYVIFVTTKHNRDIIEKILPLCNLLIERPNIGRDIGSYQFGVQWVNKNLISINQLDSLILANDTLFYPQNFNETLNQILEIQNDVCGLFESQVPIRHIQSFFIMFRQRVLKSSYFIRFWSKYIPLSSRLHAIVEGELELSKILEPHFSFGALYSYRKINKILESACDVDLLKILDLLPKYPLLIRRFNRITKFVHISNKKNYKYISRMQVKDLLYFCLDNTNPSHSLSLLFNVFQGAPLKTDLVSKSTYSVSDIFNKMLFYTREEMDDIQHTNFMKISRIKKNKVSRVLADFGLL